MVQHPRDGHLSRGDYDRQEMDGPGLSDLGNGSCGYEELTSEPRVEGRFWFEGGPMLIQDTARLPRFNACVQGQETGKYDVERLETGHIRFVPLEDECAERRTLLGSGEMERVR